MTKILNFALKIKGVVGRVAHAKSSDPATPKIWNVHLIHFSKNFTVSVENVAFGQKSTMKQSSSEKLSWK